MTPVEMIAEGHRLITEGLALLSKAPLTLVPSEAPATTVPVKVTELDKARARKRLRGLGVRV